MLSLTSNYPRPTSKKHYAVILILLLWLIIIVLALINQRNILDWLKLRGYKPPIAVINLAQEDTMTAYATKIFKVNHPSIESEAAFNKNCPNDGGEKTIVLGCYHSDQNGIFLLSVSDPRLQGVEQVTAAHEMLHSAYERLSTSERNKVDAMLLNYYNHDLHDQRIKDDIALYRQTEPNQVVNEMHSVFGTEVTNLPKALAQYYSRYFSDRQKISAYANQYESAFTSRQNEVDQDNTKLVSLKQQIDTLDTDISSQYKTITSEQATLNSEKSSNVNAYNAAVSSYNALIETYKEEITQVNSLITQYNGLVDDYNQASLVEKQLYQELSGVSAH
jgi:uncharacterized protein YdaU (DUF1376 family)